MLAGCRRTKGVAGREHMRTAHSLRHVFRKECLSFLGVFDNTQLFEEIPVLIDFPSPGGVALLSSLPLRKGSSRLCCLHPQI
jgi:hypothetical protein